MMKRLATSILTLCSSTVLAVMMPAEAGAQEQLRPEPPRFRIEVPDVILTNVPVEEVTVVALDADGHVDTAFEGRPLIQGVRLVVRRQETALPPFREGRLELQTDLAAGRKVYVTENEIAVDPEGLRPARLSVTRIPRWFSLLPPVLAILLAVWLRNVVVALFAAVWSGAAVLSHGNVVEGFVRTLDTYLLNQLVGQETHMMIVLFTLFLGAMVGVMAGSGGTRALVVGLARFTQKREHGQLMTWAMGFLVFFDDYANTLLVGSTMRPVTDRLRISREKLAFLVDSTAAPIAGLAIVSTWVGAEVIYIADTYEVIYRGTDLEWDGYTTFLATLPYRFYPLHLIVFVWLIAYSGHDYGPMLKAEARAFTAGQLTRPGASVAGVGEDELNGDQARRQLLRNALVPLALLLGLIVAGLWWTGLEGLAAANEVRQREGRPLLPATFWTVLSESNGERVLFLSSFVASIAAVATAVMSRALTLHESIDSWLRGAKSMFLAIVILVLAWAVAALCDANHLNTAGFLVELTRGRLAVSWMPTLAFLLAAAVSFATGSSWATMGLLTPLFISMTHYLLVDLNEADPHHHLMLAAIGAILAGSIFGDHCSPISDTTVLSSAATGCDHLDHVMTQIPYAGSVALVALLLGYVPIGFGYWQPLVLLPLGLVVLYLLVQFLGRPPQEYAKTGEGPAGPNPEPGTAEFAKLFEDADEPVPPDHLNPQPKE